MPKSKKSPDDKTGYQTFKLYLRRRNIIQQQCLEVIRNCAVCHFANYKQHFVGDEDVAWLCQRDQIVNHTAAGSLANRKHTSSRPAVNQSL